jgi:hypothetical protein
MASHKIATVRRKLTLSSETLRVLMSDPKPTPSPDMTSIAGTGCAPVPDATSNAGTGCAPGRDLPSQQGTGCAAPVSPR